MTVAKRYGGCNFERFSTPILRIYDVEEKESCKILCCKLFVLLWPVNLWPSLFDSGSKQAFISLAKWIEKTWSMRALKDNSCWFYFITSWRGRIKREMPGTIYSQNVSVWGNIVAIFNTQSISCSCTYGRLRWVASWKFGDVGLGVR